MNREKKKINKFKSRFERSKSKSRGVGCWQCDENGYFQRDCKQEKNGDGKGKKNDSVYVIGSDKSGTMILSLAGSNESWVIDRMPPFMPLLITKSFTII